MDTLEAALTKLLPLAKAGYWPDRIIHQLVYAFRISGMTENKYEDLIKKTVDFINDSFLRDGAITTGTAREAEKLISVISPEAKKFKLLCAGHAHIDMNWMWRWDETVQVVLDTFRTVLDLMEEYPLFKFSQSQASVYEIVEKYNPFMLKEIKRRIAEGRWEVTASTWVEADKNLPDGESMARHLLYTRNYLSELLEMDPEAFDLDFEPDTFGHSLNIPDILSDGGVKYYYHCRGAEGPHIYKWTSPSGRSVLTYREPSWYNGAVDSYMAVHVPEFCSGYGIDTMLKVYGVGDHGGGPTRRDIERILDMGSWPVFPEVSFGTFREYFHILERNSDNFSVISEELNFVFTGCYASQSRIKASNKTAEAVLAESEAFNAISSLNDGFAYSKGAFAGAWKKILFNQFHDIIPGTGTVDTREYAMGLFQDAMAVANSRRSAALTSLAASMDTSGLLEEDAGMCMDIEEGAGVGFGTADFRVTQSGRGRGKSRIYTVFNPSPYKRTDIAEITAWDWNGDISRIIFKDASGTVIQHQVLGSGFDNYWGHYCVRLLIKAEVSGCGCNTYVMRENPDVRLMTPFINDIWDIRLEKNEPFVMENDLLRIIVNSRDASILSFYDKAGGSELVGAGSPAGIFQYIEEDDVKGMTAWISGRFMNVRPLVENVRVTAADLKNNIRKSISFEIAFASSKIKAEMWLDEDSSFLCYKVECDWHESGAPGRRIPRLAYHLPLAYECPEYIYDVPFGVIHRDGINADVPANGWAGAVCKKAGGRALMLASCSGNSFRCVDNSMSLTLLRSSYDPDPYPESGLHKFKFAVGIADASSNAGLINSVRDYYHPFSVISSRPHKGILPVRCEFFGVCEGSVVVSSVKMPENPESCNELLIRLYETEGEDTRVRLQFYWKVKAACFVDIHEKILMDRPVIEPEGNRIGFDLQSCRTAGILVRFDI